MLGIEFGWVFACTGRQPWVIYRMMSTADAATRAIGLAPLFWLFMGLYVPVAVITAFVFLAYFRRHPLRLESDELERKGVGK